METIQVLSDNLGVCRKLSRKIIKNSIDIIKKIDKEDEELVEDILEEFPFLTKPNIFSKLKKAILDITKEPERVLKEIDGFSNTLLREGEENIYTHERMYPFLLRVWSGDIYDKTQNDGLKELIKDLNKNFEYVESEENFIDFVRKNYLF